MLREGLLAEDTGAGERQAGSQGEGCTTRVGWQWDEAMVVLFTGQRHTFTTAPSARAVISDQFGPLKTAGAVMDIPEAHKQGYRGRYVGHTFLPSSRQKQCLGPPAAGKCHVSGQEPFVRQVSLPQQGAFPRGAARAARSM